MARIELVDTTLRDGNQSLWSAMGMSTATVLEAAPAIERAGYRVVEFINSTIMGVAVRTHREDPWERIRLAAAAMPTTPLGFLTTGRRFITWQRTPDAVLELAFSLLVRNGIRRFWIVDPMNDIAAAARTASLVRAVGAEEVVVGVVFGMSPVHTDAYFAAKAAEIPAGTIDAVYLKDPGGLLTPDRIRTLVPALQGGLDGLELTELHSHCNTGLAPHCYLEAVQLGVTTLHCAVSPLANGSSQPSVESIARNLRQLGHEVPVDDDAVAEAAAFFRGVAARYRLPLGAPNEFDVGYYRHQVPGGMATTLARQLREIGVESRLDEVLEEVPRVREELGWPIMVTPFAQYVGTQAVMNVVGAERYQSVPDEVIRYVLGEFGEPPAPMNDEVRDRILGLPRTREIAAEGSADDGAATIAELRRKHGSRVSDEELLLRAVLSADLVDGIQRPSRQAAAAVAQPARELLAAAAARGDLRRLEVRKGTFSLTVERDR